MNITIILFCIHKTDAVEVPTLSENVDDTLLSKFLHHKQAFNVLPAMFNTMSMSKVCVDCLSCMVQCMFSAVYISFLPNFTQTSTYVSCVEVELYLWSPSLVSRLFMQREEKSFSTMISQHWAS